MWGGFIKREKYASLRCAYRARHKRAYADDSLQRSVNVAAILVQFLIPPCELKIWLCLTAAPTTQNPSFKRTTMLRIASLNCFR